MAAGDIPLVQVVDNWTKRAAGYSSAGIDPKYWKPLAKRDIEGVKKGNSAATDPEIQQQILAAATGRSAVGVPQRQTGFLHTLGNIGPNIADITTHFIPGLVKTAQHLPGEVVDFADLVTGGVDDPAKQFAKYGMTPDEVIAASKNELGGSLRALSHTPLIHLLPLINTGAEATTSEGRKNLQRNPVGAALDVGAAVLPVIKPLAAARAATLADASTTAAEVADKTLQAARAATPTATAEEAAAAAQEATRLGRKASAMEALGEGHPLKAISRITPNPVSFLGNVREAGLSEGLVNTPTISETLGKVADAAGIGAKAKGMAVEKAVTDRLAQKAGRAYLDNIKAGAEEAFGAPVTGEIEKKAVEYSSIRGAQPIPAEYERLLNFYKQAGVELGKTYEGRVARIADPISGFEGTYNIDHPVAKAAAQVERIGKSVDRWRGIVDSQAKKAAEAEDNLSRNVGKIPFFHETPEAYQARTVGPITPQAIGEAVQTLRDGISQYEPKNVGLPGGAAATWRAMVDPEHGALPAIQKAAAEGDIKAMRRALQDFRGAVKGKVFDRIDGIQDIRAYADHLYNETVGLNPRFRAFSSTAIKAERANTKLARAEKRATRFAQLHVAAQDKLVQQFTINPPAEFMPMLTEQLKRKAAASLPHLTPELLQEQLTAIESGNAKDVVGSKALAEMRDDVLGNWRALAEAGHDPVWLPAFSSTKLRQIANPSVLMERTDMPSILKNRTLSMSASVQSFQIGLTGAAVELIKEGGAQHMIDYVSKFAKDRASIVQEATLDVLKRRGGRNFQDTILTAKDLMADQYLHEKYVKWEPDKLFTTGPAKVGGVATGTEMYIPKEIYKTIQGLMPKQKNWLELQIDKSTGLFKTSVLIGPRFVANNIIGDMVFILGNSDARLLTQFKAAWENRHNLDPYISPGVDALDPQNLIDLEISKTMGQRFWQKIMYTPRKIQAVNEAFNNFSKSLMYIHGEDAALRAGMGQAAAREAGLEFANRTLINLDELTPIERRVLKQAVPFYGFYKQVIKYLAAYPADHPLRAGFLSNMARQEQEEQLATGQPGYLSSVVKIPFTHVRLDLSNANPFRDAGSFYSMTGWLNGLHPLLKEGLEIAGVSPQSESADPYAATTIDRERGVQQSKRNSGGVPEKLAEDLIPQLKVFGDAIDAMLGNPPGGQGDAITIGQYGKGLIGKKPEGMDYNRPLAGLLSTLNLPFGINNTLAGKVIDPITETQKAEKARIKQSGAEVSAALKGQPNNLQGFQNVMFQGKLLPVSQVQAMLNAASGAGVAPGAIIPKSSSKKGKSLVRKPRKPSLRIKKKR